MNGKSVIRSYQVTQRKGKNHDKSLSYVFFVLFAVGIFSVFSESCVVLAPNSSVQGFAL